MGMTDDERVEAARRRVGEAEHDFKVWTWGLFALVAFFPIFALIMAFVKEVRGP